MARLIVSLALLAGCSKSLPGSVTPCGVATKVRQGAEAAEAFICGGASVGGENASEPEIWTGEE